MFTEIKPPVDENNTGMIILGIVYKSTENEFITKDIAKITVVNGTVYKIPKTRPLRRLYTPAI